MLLMRKVLLRGVKSKYKVTQSQSSIMTSQKETAIQQLHYTKLQYQNHQKSKPGRNSNLKSPSRFRHYRNSYNNRKYAKTSGRKKNKKNSTLVVVGTTTQLPMTRETCSSLPKTESSTTSALIRSTSTVSTWMLKKQRGAFANGNRKGIQVPSRKVHRLVLGLPRWAKKRALSSTRAFLQA